MEKSELLKLDVEFEPFLVDNKITKECQLQWLAFRNVITLDNLEKGIFRIKVDKRSDGILSCKNYEKTCQLLDAYTNVKARLQIGKMGTKVNQQNDITNPNEIDPESVPF